MRNESDRALLTQIGKIIKRKRCKTHYSQEDLAECLKTSQATICRYEQVKTNPPVLTLKHIADKCNFDMTDYFIRIEEPSDMYKKIIRRYHRVPKKRTMADAAFDKIMQKPENADAVKVLYHLSEVSTMLPKSFDIDYVTLVQTIILEKADSQASYKRLWHYFDIITKSAKKRQVTNAK